MGAAFTAAIERAPFPLAVARQNAQIRIASAVPG